MLYIFTPQGLSFGNVRKKTTQNSKFIEMYFHGGAQTKTQKLLLTSLFLSHLTFDLLGGPTATIFKILHIRSGQFLSCPPGPLSLNYFHLSPVQWQFLKHHFSASSLTIRMIL